MNIPDGFFENPVSPEYTDLLSTMRPAIYFTEPPCHTSGDCEYIDCGAITLRDQSLFFNCGYVSPPLKPNMRWYNLIYILWSVMTSQRSQIFPGTLNRPLRVLYLKKICLL